MSHSDLDIITQEISHYLARKWTKGQKPKATVKTLARKIAPKKDILAAIDNRRVQLQGNTVVLI